MSFVTSSQKGSKSLITEGIKKYQLNVLFLTIHYMYVLFHKKNFMWTKFPCKENMIIFQLLLGKKQYKKIFQ